MGMFAGKGGKKFDWGSAALAFFGGPQVASSIMEQKRERAKAEQEQVQLQQLHSVIDADPTLATPQDKAYAKANPKAYIENYMSRFQQRQFGPGGGSIMSPKAGGGYDTLMAPSRHEYQGSVFDVSGGAPGTQGTVTPQHQGTQWVTPQPGAEAFGVNSFTGDRVMRPTAGGKALTDDDIRRMEQGGAGSQAPRPFRRPY